MAGTKLSKKERVLQMLEEGTYTKGEMAEELDCKIGSINSNFTYLRWGGYFIKTDEEGICSLITEEEAKAIEAEKLAKRKEKTPATTKTPAEQLEAVKKSLKRMNTTLENWEQKQDNILIELDELDREPNEDEQDLREEAAANITLYKIKIKRANARLADLEALVEDNADDTDAEIDEAADADADAEAEEELM